MMSRRSVILGALAASAITASPAHARRRTGMELRETFGGMADGPAPNVAATGQAMTDFAPYGPAGEPWIRNGFMSGRYPAQFEGGCYRIARLENAVTKVGARFAFTPEYQTGGVLCLSIQMGNLGETHPSIPVSPMHFYISPVSWNMDVNTEAGTQVDYVASGGLYAPLVADGQTLHTVEVTLDRAASQCRVDLPDGQRIVMTDSRFNRGGRYVYVEPFKMPGGDPGAKATALVREWWADS